MSSSLVTYADVGGLAGFVSEGVGAAPGRVALNTMVAGTTFATGRSSSLQNLWLERRHSNGGKESPH